MKYHYSRKEGWLGNPCGLVYFKGKYHLFFQLNPYLPRYGLMHWGHAVSEDLISWEECPVAISPEEEMCCNSGSAIVHDNRIWLFYNATSSDGKETIRAAYSEDGICFSKSDKNPISASPFEGSSKFREPFVFKYKNSFRMIVGAGNDGIAKVLQYESDDLINWNYMGELLSDGRFGSVIEVPQLAEVDGKWIFIIQSERHIPTKVLFATGDYDGHEFVFDDEKEPFKPVDLGDDFFNPVICEDEEGRKVLMAWMFSMRMNSSSISIPRELFISRKGEVCLMPYGGLKSRQIRESRFVSYGSGRLRVQFEGRTLFDKAYRECPEISVIEDVGTVEVFLDGGRENISLYIC
ncbi:beta-fructofuranosidase [Ruminococcaceae bacterium R-25]|nr:beta-fructofuranosidase [Ruminococcaceae bacterium R-25]SUQ21984.1 beta-fructofuranosidase [Oscillospiraceae bacterium]